MKDGEDGMLKKHFWSGVTHDLLGLRPLRGFVTMNGAFGARRFLFSKGAAL